MEDSNASSSSSSSSSGPASSSSSSSSSGSTGVETSSGATTCGECLSLSLDGRQFFACAGPSTWPAARDTCQLCDLALASIPDSATNDVLASLLVWPEQAWIGLSDRDAESEWTWTDLATAEFRNWAEGEPSEVDPADDCASLRSDGSWDATRCDIPRSYVCAAAL